MKERTTMQEFAYKRLLIKELYESVCSWCKQLYHTTEQMYLSYYYDTPDGTCAGSNITVYIQQQGTALTGRVKYHGIAGLPYQAQEEIFRVDGLPMYMDFGGRWISLIGQMVTERICVPVADGVELKLDKNSYLGKVDYELKMEFLPEKQRKADAFLQWLEQQFFLQKKGTGKYARYFVTLTEKKKGNNDETFRFR